VIIPPAEVIAQRTDGAELGCPTCHRSFANVVIVRKKVTADVDEDDGSFTIISVDAPRGARITLEPGFVNAKRRHPSGAAWYVRGRPDRPARSLLVPLPAVITCHCGAVSRLPNLIGDVAVYASGTEVERRAAVVADLATERADEARAASKGLRDYLIDRGRGKSPADRL
jgi:hypothetical protein